MQDYDSFIDGTTGKQLFIDTGTGEVFDGIAGIFPKGTIHYTPKQQERYKSRQESRAAKKWNITDAPFYFAKCTERIPLQPETLTRLFFLMAFSSYKENGCKLLLNKLQQMQKSDLSKVLDISRPTANKFYNEVSPDYIMEMESGLVWADSGCFYRGAGLAMSKDAAYMKVFCDSIKKLYKGLQGKGHKYLGYIFQLLPYVNREHNILCWNPEEKDKCSIQRMNLLDVCGLVGFDTKHIDRLFNILASQKFDIDGCEEGYFRLLNQPNSNDYRTADILINPHLFYAGTDFRQADYAYATGARRKKLIGIDHQ